MRFAKVAVDTKSRFDSKLYTYTVPPHLERRIAPGRAVIVPFGRRLALGVAVRLLDEPDHPEPKEVVEVLGGALSATENLVELAEWIAERYAADLGGVFSAMAPAGQVVRFVRSWGLGGNAQAASRIRSEPSKALVQYLTEKKRAISEDTILRRFPNLNRGSIAPLKKKGIVREIVGVRIAKPSHEHGLLSPPPSAPKVDLPDPETRRKIAKGVAEPGRPLMVIAAGEGRRFGCYVCAAQAALRDRKQVLWLGPQHEHAGRSLAAVRRYADASAELYTSELPIRKRLALGAKALSGRAKVIVGTRGALFLPFRDLGALILDCEEDTAWAGHQHPHFDTREAALKLARISGAQVLLGSPAPSLLAAHRTQRGDYHDLRLEYHKIPQAKIVGRELDPQVPPRMLMPTVAFAAKHAVQRGYQVLLYHNRRGSSRVVCRDCGFSPRCPECDGVLVYHSDERHFRCPTCGRKEMGFERCPSCSGSNVRYLMKGTQALEREVAGLLPGARIARLDSDAVKTPADLETHLAAFSSGELDAIVATQMVVGRVTSPRVAVLIVVLLDALYEAPGYDSAETAFCTVARLACDLPGLKQFFVQTHQPEHYLARALASGDPNLFYGPESETRVELGYPPFSRLAAFETNAGKEAAQLIAEAIEGSDAAKGGMVVVAGPETFVSPPGARTVWRVLAKLKEGVKPGELVDGATAGLDAESKRRLTIRFIP